MKKQVIAVIGAGGKTTALGLLANQCGKEAVLITTTTHIYPMTPPACRVCLTDPTAEELADALGVPGIVCAGSGAKQGKLGILPRPVLDVGLKTADIVVYEGDGANHHPLKLHRSHEPVILPQTTHCLIVAGLSGLGQRADAAVHRFDREWEPGKMIEVRELLRCIMETAESSGLPKQQIRFFLNQADVLADLTPAQEAVENLEKMGFSARFGSLRKDAEGLFEWVTAD